MQRAYTFDDVLIIPQFSAIKSRKDVVLSTILGMKLPVISTNMDTVTEAKMAQALHHAGGLGCLHRFCTIEENIQLFKASPKDTIVSFGLGEYEKQRVAALYTAGATRFCLDLAHGSQQQVVDCVSQFKTDFPNTYLIVGCFGSDSSLVTFINRCKKLPDAIRANLGSGSACSTRVMTGCGYPQFSLIQNLAGICRKYNIHLISDGGMTSIGDIAKALGAGAHAVMCGRFFAGTEEAPGAIIQEGENKYKVYRGSASKESYIDQGKIADWRTAEGEAFLVSYKGPVKNILQTMEGGLRSAFTYVGAANLNEFHEKCYFTLITPSGIKENGVHGKHN